MILQKYMKFLFKKEQNQKKSIVHIAGTTQVLDKTIWGLLKTLNVILNLFQYLLFQHLLKFRRLTASSSALRSGCGSSPQ